MTLNAVKTSASEIFLKELQDFLACDCAINVERPPIFDPDEVATRVEKPLAIIFAQFSGLISKGLEIWPKLI